MGEESRTLTGGCNAAWCVTNATPSQHIFNCHCEDCQHFSGAPCTTPVIVPEDQLVVNGELEGFKTVGESGGSSWYFCPKCGTPVIVKPEAFLGMKAIKASSLDDSSWLTPDGHISKKQTALD